MSQDAFARLQKSTTGGGNFDSMSLRNAMMYQPESPETFSTFFRALARGKIQPTDAFIIASLLSVEVSSIYVRYVGLALRYGANANAYVDAPYAFEDENEITVPIHIGRRLWDLTPGTLEESMSMDYQVLGVVYDEKDRKNTEPGDRFDDRRMACLDILCLMAIQGFIPEAKITTASLLAQKQINALQFATYHNDVFSSSVYGSIMASGDFGEAAASEIKYFAAWKASLQNVVDVHGQRSQKILDYSLYLDLKEVLTMSAIYDNPTNIQNMYFYQDLESLKIIVPMLKQLGRIGVKKSDYIVDDRGFMQANEDTRDKRKVELILMRWALEHYAIEVFKILLDLGTIVEYEFRTKVIKTAKNICPLYPVQCQILNTMIIDMVRSGFALDSAQLQLLNSYSPSTFSEVKTNYTTPFWLNLCRTQDGDITDDMRELARKVGLPTGLNKDQMCGAFSDMRKSSPEDLTNAIHKVNLGQITYQGISPTDVALGRRVLNDQRSLPAKLSTGGPQARKDIEASAIPKGSEQMRAPICKNSDTLLRNIEDYPDVDRVSYSDGQFTWCFTSENFPELIQSRRNPFSTSGNSGFGTPIPDHVIAEMEEKLRIINQNGLSQKPASISEGVREVFDSNPAINEMVNEKATKLMLEKFYLFVQHYNVDHDRFTELSPDELQSIADNILSDDTRVVLDQSSPVLALRDFASAVINEIELNADMDEIGNALYSIFNPK